MTIRKTAAVWAGKATGVLSRMTRRGGGTTLPGDVARAIDPRILTRLAQGFVKTANLSKHAALHQQVAGSRRE